MTFSATATILTSDCGTCGKKQNLLRCSGCKVIFYCSGAHQAAHRQAHKSACNAIKGCRIALEEKIERIRRYQMDVLMMPDPFGSSASLHWRIYNACDYISEQFKMVGEMRRVRTIESVQTQLENCMEMLPLCRGDHLGIRHLVPALLLRLDKDQECYDFMVRWLFAYDDFQCIWEKPGVPYPDIKNIDVFDESVRSESFCEHPFNLSHAVSVTLLKIKLILDIMALDYTTTTVGSKVPREILDSIQSYVIRSPITASDKEYFTDNRYRMEGTVYELEDQVDVLYKKIKKSNRHFWPALVNPRNHLTARPDSGTHTHEPVEEMQLVLQWTYDAWVETPGAIGIIKSKIKEDVWQELY